ncbi:MAG: response regulator transcription factor [Deltaproteobacteria bacterium]|nr:response regulator transcription factor [Deltaproteobacteria bacterium]
MIKIMIADDHAVVREGLKQIISDTPNMIVVAEAENGDTVMEMLGRVKPDVIVLDISMPDTNIIELLKAINASKQKVRVLVLSMHPESQYAERVFAAGACGYLTKDSAPDLLITAIRKVAANKHYVSESLGEALASRLDRNAERPLHQSLSNREYQVLCMFASGKTVKEIAEDLCLSDKTISTYRKRILEKMGMETNAELIRYAIRHNLV